MFKIYRKFFTDKELLGIESLIGSYLPDEFWSKSKATGKGDMGDGSYGNSRKSTARIIQPYRVDRDLIKKLISVIEIDFDCNLYPLEAWSIQKYVGESKDHFYWHQDTLDFFRVSAYDINNKTPDEIFVQNTTPLRKISISVALNDRDEYNGGQFVIDMGDGKKSPVDLDRGDMIAFTSDTFHGVEDMQSGERQALIIWLVDNEEYIAWKELSEEPIEPL